ncbi:sulfotransferase family protein [Paucihalobacter ruber]|uniref:Sulfotransferase family protein n=1 Tax=Paucihalobacter ruber TaxID=2567861 RepID=A0A506PKM8_9FLAO|nr:sulfotransferase family 2 domain-containing protein [Paucihalobacter ruber]TPV33865.1 sulfotransferase family protein [Paucihalobacter ruber]
MISHKHKCIFIHISKCAGSSIEKAFDIDVFSNATQNNKNFFGWSEKNKLFLQHATPQQLFDCEYLNYDIWDNYYKFIVVRNPYSRMMSDYFWISKTNNIIDTFENFILKKGKYYSLLNNNSTPDFRGDHLNSQYSYFQLNNKIINYDAVISFEDFNTGILKLNIKNELKEKILNNKINKSGHNMFHYSHFYNFNRKKIVERIYNEDIKFLNYHFENKHNFKSYIKAQLPSVYFLK